MRRRSSLSLGAVAPAVFFAIASISVAVACTSFSGDTASDTEAGKPDADATDAAPSGDEVAPPTDAGAWIPCALRPIDSLKFCDDFDDAAQRIDFRWSSKSLTGSGSLDASASAVSAPRALAAGLLPSDTGARGEATVRKAFMVDVTAKKKMTFSFSQRWEAQPYAPNATGPGYMVVASVQFRPAECMTSPSANTRSVNLNFTPKGALYLAAAGFAADCVDGGQDYAAIPTPLRAVDFSAYRAIRIVIAKAPCTNGPQTTASATLEADGMTDYICLPLTVDPFQRADVLSAVLGLSAGDGPYLGAIATFDNATFEIE